jgi:Leucine-rich repeat (LRR) protein
VISVYCEDCPKPETLKPCFCDSSVIYCGGNETLNLKVIFHRISSELAEGKKHFKHFYLTNTSMNELVENTFEDITFEHIRIVNVSNLSLIHTFAFSSLNHSLNRIEISNTSLINSPPNYDIFTAMSSMVGLEVLEISHSLIEEIPDNAFRPINGQQKNLTVINLYNNKINRIGDNAFQNLNSLSKLYIEHNKINHISDKALIFGETSENTFILYLFGCLLNSSSFAIGAFNNLNRPTWLYLSYREDINNITYLDQHIFETFLYNNKNNQIILNELDCNDCRSFWLFKNAKFSPQIERLECKNGTNFSESSNFSKCKE